MGPSQGLILQGYGIWAKVVEKIIKVVRRLIPRERRKIIRRIPVDGSPFLPIEIPVMVIGNPFEFKDLELPILGNPVIPFSLPAPILGSPIHQVQKDISLTGNLGNFVTSHLEILGAPSSRFELQLPCRGEKDFKKMLWEVLEGENGEE